jgi:hypothetical protein
MQLEIDKLVVSTSHPQKIAYNTFEYYVYISSFVFEMDVFQEIYQQS